MKRILRDQLIYGFDATTPPVLTIEPGETIVVESHDMDGTISSRKLENSGARQCG